MLNQNKFRLLSGALLIAAAVMFLIINISSGYFFKSMRLDLTAGKIYTLSHGSKQIVAKITEPITVRLYFSKKLAKVNPYIISYATRVQDLLLQYQRASNGKIKVEFIDPEPMSTAEEEAKAYGLQAIPLDEVGNDFYFGIVASNSLAATKILPFIQPARETTLEYDLSQLLDNLNSPQRQVVGLISTLPLEGRGSRPWMVWQQLTSQFEMEVYDPDTKEIPEHVKLLMIVNPSLFTGDTLQAIDQFVMRGGNLIAYVDPYSEATDPETVALNNTYNNSTSDFDQLLAAWGVKLESQKVVADRAAAKQVNLEADGRSKVVRYPLWLDLTAANFAADDVLTTNLERMTMGTPGALSPIDNSGLKFEPIIYSSKDAMLVPNQQIQQFQEDLAGAMQNYTPTGMYTLAARITGAIKSPYTEQQSVGSNIIIVADSDMLHDHFWVVFQNILGQEFGVPNSGNGNFVVSALDNLSGSEALISIRNRGTFVRPFTRMQDLEVAAQSEDRNTRLIAANALQSLESKIKFFSVGMIPLIIICGGITLWCLQIRRESKLKQKL